MTELPALPTVTAEWLPLHPADITAVSCGIWWDIVRAPEDAGRAAIARLQSDGRNAGAAFIDPIERDPRIYFLVPLGTAASWALRGTVPLGMSSHVVIPPVEYRDGHRTHWIVPPVTTHSMMDPEQLRAALTYCGVPLVRSRP
jgi:hypothetical protein